MNDEIVTFLFLENFIYVRVYFVGSQLLFLIRDDAVENYVRVGVPRDDSEVVNGKAFVQCPQSGLDLFL